MLGWDEIVALWTEANDGGDGFGLGRTTDAIDKLADSPDIWVELIAYDEDSGTAIYVQPGLSGMIIVRDLYGPWCVRVTS